MLLAFVGAACGSRVTSEDAGAPATDATIEAVPDASWVPGCEPDTDGDGISDEDEVLSVLGRDGSDFDRDGVPNRLDDDSDGDGVLDRDEAGDGDLCTLPTDCDAAPEYCPVRGGEDFLDQDSDDDGAPDGEEVAHGLDGCAQDSDADGCPDVAVTEIGSCPVDEGDLFLSVPCYEVVEGQVAIMVSEDLEGVRDWVSLEIVPLPGRQWSLGDAVVEIHAQGADPPEAALADGDRFRDVLPGARLVFVVSVTGDRNVDHCAWRTDWAALRLLSDLDEILTDRRIALTTEECIDLL